MRPALPLCAMKNIRELNKFKLPQGLRSWTSLKRHYSLLPLMLIVTGGMSMGIFFLTRAATHDPDANWSHTDDLVEEKYRHKQSKLINPTRADFSKMGMQIPDYADDKKAEMKEESLD